MRWKTPLSFKSNKQVQEERFGNRTTCFIEFSPLLIFSQWAMTRVRELRSGKEKGITEDTMDKGQQFGVGHFWKVDKSSKFYYGRQAKG